MEREQIIKALECCTDKNYHCEDCPYFYKSEGIKSSMEILMTDALSLIKELTEDVEWSAKRIIEADKKLASQREEIRRLQNCIHNLKQSRTAHREKAERVGKQLREVLDDKAKLTEENERLKVPMYLLRADGGVELMPTIESIKADTVRKMQTEIKKTFSAICKGEMVDLYRIIDQIAKEMLEGEG